MKIWQAILLCLLFLLLWKYITFDESICKSCQTLTEEDKKEFYLLVNDLNKLFTQNRVEYFAICGTLLGVERHQDMIPWDDDIDIGVNKKDFISMIPVFKANNYEISKWYFGYKLYKKDKQKYFIDVFTFEEIIDKRGSMYVYSEAKARQLFKTEYFLINSAMQEESELFPLQQRTFGTTKIWAPNNPIPYLNRTYKDWSEKGLCTYYTHNDASNSTWQEIKDQAAYMWPRLFCFSEKSRTIPFSKKA